LVYKKILALSAKLPYTIPTCFFMLGNDIEKSIQDTGAIMDELPCLCRHDGWCKSTATKW
jgi:hypothetical protein